MTGHAPEDDPSIPDSAVLWRRVPPWHLVAQQSRPSSAAFEDDKDGRPLSVAVADVTGSVDVLLSGHDGFGVVEFTVGEARRLGLGVRYEPGDYPGHAVLTGRKTDSVRRKLAKGCEWVRRPREP